MERIKRERETSLFGSSFEDIFIIPLESLSFAIQMGCVWVLEIKFNELREFTYKINHFLKTSNV